MVVRFGLVVHCDFASINNQVERGELMLLYSTPRALLSQAPSPWSTVDWTEQVDHCGALATSYH